MPELQNPDEKPCLVETPQGFSVSYKNKLLYSKYNPQKAILAAVRNLQVLPGTLFLCCSPVLPYGLKELLARLDEKSFCLLCDFDPKLWDFSASYYASQGFRDDKAARLTPSELKVLPQILNEPSYTTTGGARLLPSGSFRRVIRLDFSAGVQLHQSLYEELAEACTNAIMTFWANRITLVKFGRKYSQNFFRNLRLLPLTTPIQSFFCSVTRPIVVFGAGESAEEGIRLMKNAATSSFHVLCADTALQPLLASGIQVDGVFIEEAQAVIKSSLIGTQKSPARIFAGLSAVPHLDRLKNPQKISFFTTLYAKAGFIKKLEEQGLLPPCNEPFGSVGLTALYYALKFRKSEEIPVYIYGLDFSYRQGKTHARGTLAHKKRLLESTRLFPVADYAASFGRSAEKVTGKKGSPICTTRTLKSYAKLFCGIFAGTKNLFDGAGTGLPLGIPHKSLAEAFENEISGAKKGVEKAASKASAPGFQKDTVSAFLQSEKALLEELRDILSGKIPLPPSEQKRRATELAAPREYLYLHFPDGLHFSYESSFLKRLRTEIDFFLKFF